MEGFYYDTRWKVLICKSHCRGLHPTPQAIARHLRGAGHSYHGKQLKYTLTKLVELDLASIQNVLATSLSRDRAVSRRAIPHLRIVNGFRCTAQGCLFLTTSLELQKRHISSCQASFQGNHAKWERCKLQTIFQETKHRRYFQVNYSDGVSPETGQCPNDVTFTSSRPLESDTNPTQDEDFEMGLANPTEGNKPGWTLSLPHPIAQLASVHVRYLNPETLNQIFCSSAFQSASYPLFDPTHIDAQHGLLSVFPGCESEPAFLHALVYAMLQFLPEHDDTRKLSEMAKQQTVNQLNPKLSPASLSVPVIGAVSILKISAFKFDDIPCHDIHTKGLAAMLQKCDQSLLTANLKRSLFWQNLYTDSSLSTLPFAWEEMTSETVWQDAAYGTIRGFVNADIDLPGQLLRCIVNTLEFQAVRCDPIPSSYNSRYLLYDSMQASIQSRLILLKDDCVQCGLHVEAIRLATFLSCYYSGIHVSTDNLIPGKLSLSLCQLLETSLVGPRAAKVWHGRWDILLWTLLIASCAAEESNSQVVKQLRRRSIYLTRAALADIKQHTVLKALERALTAFVYSRDWVNSRQRILDWADLEKSIRQTRSAID